MQKREPMQMSFLLRTQGGESEAFIEGKKKPGDVFIAGNELIKSQSK